MTKYALIFLILFPIQLIAQSIQIDETIIISGDLKIKRITDHTYLHLSYMSTEQYGRIESNGGIIVLNNEVMIFDTPHNEEVTSDLVNWITDQGWEITGVVASHFHFDGMGGLPVFHELDIPTYGHTLSPELSNSSDYQLTPPENLFDGKIQLNFADQFVNLEYYGPGHTSDNIIFWFPADRVLFGGCLIKSMRAGKGNLDDANIEKWSETVRMIKTEYKDQIDIVVPGHGVHGGVELLEKTIDMFSDQ